MTTNNDPGVGEVERQVGGQAVSAGGDIAFHGLANVSRENLDAAGALARRRLHALIRRALSRRGVKQSDLAAALGVNKSTISRVLSQPSNLTVENAGRIMRALNCWIEFTEQEIGPKRPLKIAYETNHGQQKIIITMIGDLKSDWIGTLGLASGARWIIASQDARPETLNFTTGGWVESLNSNPVFTREKAFNRAATQSRATNPVVVRRYEEAENE